MMFDAPLLSKETMLSLRILAGIAALTLPIPVVDRSLVKKPEGGIDWTATRKAFLGRVSAHKGACLVWVCLLLYSLYTVSFSYVWPLDSKPAPYALHEVRITRNPVVKIILDEPSLTSGEIAATCMAAGKYYAEKLKRAPVRVEAYAFVPGVFYADGALLGRCIYEGGHEDIDPDWNFGCYVADPVPSPQQLAINQLYAEWNYDFRNTKGDAVLDEERLEKAIAAKLGLAAAKEQRVQLVEVATLLMPEPEAEAPTNPQREELMPLFEELNALALDFMHESWTNVRDPEFLRCLAAAGCDTPKIQQWRKDLAALEAFVAAHPELPEKVRDVAPLIREFVMSHVKGKGANLPFHRAQHILRTR